MSDYVENLHQNFMNAHARRMSELDDAMRKLHSTMGNMEDHTEIGNANSAANNDASFDEIDRKLDEISDALDELLNS